MRKIIVMNAKGGCGKTTIATNLASYYAVNGYSTALFDYDPQGSSAQWLKRRSEEQPEIQGVSAFRQSGSVTRSWQMRLSNQAERIIIDTPAGMQIHQVQEYLRGVDTIVIPVLSSMIDVEASSAFIKGLQRLPAVRNGSVRIVVVANRVKPHANAISTMETLLEDLNVPVIAQLRDSINYVHGTDAGIGIHELPLNRAKSERVIWAALMAAVDKNADAEMQRDARRAVKVVASSAVSDIPISVPLDKVVARYSYS